MKELTQQKIADKVIFQQGVEKLMNTEAAKLLDISPLYLSMIKKPEQYIKCPMIAWRKMYAWYHSGSTLKGYDHTKAVIPEDLDDVPTIPEVKRSVNNPPEAAPPTQEAETMAKEAMEMRNQSFHPILQPNIIVNVKPGSKKKVTDPSKTKGSFDKGAPTPEEIERVLAAINIEIDIVVKLKK